MKTPALAIGWTIWRRHRWGLSATAACVAAVVGASAVARAVLDPGDALQACGIAITPLAVCALYLAGVFAYGFDTDLATAGTAFPSRMFTLPVRTGALAGWPMAYGAGALGFHDYGNTLVIDPWGAVLGRGPDDEAAVVCATLDGELLERVRRELPSLMHRRLA